MSGHSKWNNIKNKKAKTDGARAKIFTKIGREIAVAVKAGGPDPDSNSKLKDVIAKAKANNMPNDNIDRSIKKASGETGAAEYFELSYEGYGPSGVAVIVEVMTDNKNRTAGEVRHAFDKFGGNLGQTGCVGFMFDKKGIIAIEEQDGVDEEAVTMSALEAGAEDVSYEDGVFEIVTDPDEFSVIREALEKEGYEFISAEVQMVPQTYVKLENETDSVNMTKMIDMLEDNDDVQNVWHNWEE